MILLLEAQHNFEEELGQPHSPLPGANIICHHLNRPALPDELDCLAQPHLPYADWEPFLAAMYCIFGDHAKTPLIESILTRAPFPHHLIDTPVYFKAHMGPDDVLVQQLAMIRQMLESIIGRISVMVGETPELHGTAPHRKWARKNAARRMWYPRYAVPDSVLAIAPRRNTYPSDLIQPYGPHPLLYTFDGLPLRSPVSITDLFSSRIGSTELWMLHARTGASFRSYSSTVCFTRSLTSESLHNQHSRRHVAPGYSRWYSPGERFINLINRFQPHTSFCLSQVVH
ncbi:hypothetical protein R3P38DRAFT_3177220 [Favolaschia claudopus]|uniref:Uncharacterized protein n=1 Tax=Favolaschia claudopus TaxID=2862362 RepID=A0AAW0D236_9AGAR